MIRLTGFTDEASPELDLQIQVTKALGWNYLSARTVNDGNMHEISDAAFEIVCEKLEKAQLRVAEFGTLIGNWSKDIRSDWEITQGEIDRCIPRMQKLGVRYARIMSYAQLPWGDDQMEEERFRRLRQIVAQFKEVGLDAIHENCMNWGGFSADHTLRLLDEVPGLKLVFDTGNPVFQRDRAKPIHYPFQDPFEFYEKVKHAVVHLHIKDAIMYGEEGEPVYTFAGEGQAKIDMILSDLVKNNFHGFVAIEPHISTVFHLNEKSSDPQKDYDLYLEYGKRFESLLEKIKQNV